MTSWFYRAPNPDTVLIIQTPKGVFSARSLLQNNKRTGSRLISTSRLKLEEAPAAETEEIEPFSAAKCRVYNRLRDKVLHHVTDMKCYDWCFQVLLIQM